MKNILICLLFLMGCKSAVHKVCEDVYKEKTYDHERACKCAVKAAEENEIKNKEDFFIFLKDVEKVSQLAAQILISKDLSKKSKRYLDTMQDMRFCNMIDKPLDAYRLTQKGKFVKEIDKFIIVLRKDNYNKYDKILPDNLYRGGTLQGLYEFLLEKVKNVNINKHLKQNTTKNKERLKIFEDKFQKKEHKKYINLLLSMFDNNFARMFSYYKEKNNFSNQEALDQAYLQAYAAFVIIINNDLLNIYYRNLDNVYANKDYLYYYAKEHQWLDKKE